MNQKETIQKETPNLLKSQETQVARCLAELSAPALCAANVSHISLITPQAITGNRTTKKNFYTTEQLSAAPTSH